MSKLFHIVLTDALVVTTSYVSDPIFVGDKSNFGIGIAPTGTFTGEVYLEGSNDRENASSITNWFLVTDSFRTPNSEEVFYDVSDFGYSWVRLVIAITSGSITSGKIDMSLKRV